jgi:hypothetical protein
MSIPSQIFLLFYAVLFGAIFTISDRWRPFALPHKSREGWQRFLLSTVFFGVLPVGYLILVLPMLFSINATTRTCLGLAVYAVAPLVGFYFSWVWIVLWKRDNFYTPEQQELEPVRSSLQWVGKQPLSLWAIALFILVFFFLPMILLLLARWGKVFGCR